jgi:hypothetical protein
MGVQIQVWQEHSRRVKSLCMRAGEESIQSRSNCYFAMYLNLHLKKQSYWFQKNTNPRTLKKNRPVSSSIANATSLNERPGIMFVSDPKHGSTNEIMVTL